MPKKFPNLVKDTNLQIQDSQQNLSRIKSKRSTLTHIIVKLLKDRQREILESSKRGIS